jgi:hypothetical protein
MMNREAEEMLAQVLSDAKNAADFTSIRARVNTAECDARAQPDWWRLTLPGQVKDAVFADFGLPVLPMQVIALDIDSKKVNDGHRED